MTNKPENNKPKSWPYWTLIIVPILSLIPVYKNFFKKPDAPAPIIVAPTQTVTVQQYNKDSSSIKAEQPIQETKNIIQENKDKKSQFHSQNNQTETIKRTASIPIQITNSPREITIRCAEQDFEIDPVKITNSGIIKLTFSVKKRNVSGQTFKIFFYEKDRYLGVFCLIHVDDPDETKTIIL